MTARHAAQSRQADPSLHPLNQTLVALDATPHSQMVVEHLHRFVRAGESSCDFLYALPPKPSKETLADETTGEIARIVNREFDAYAQTLSAQNLAVNQRYFIPSEDSVEEALLDHIEANTPDLLVLGMHQAPKRRRTGWHIGSTSYAVATHTPCGTLIIKRPPLQANQLNVLVATDGSSHAMNAAEQLTRFLPKENVTLTLLNVVSVNVYTMPIVEPFVDYTPLENALQGAAQNLLDQAGQIFTEAGYTVANQYFVLGDPVEQILGEAQKQQADLIVLGSHGTGDRLRSWLLGSVSSKVLEYSPSSVAILR